MDYNERYTQIKRDPLHYSYSPRRERAERARLIMEGACFAGLLASMFIGFIVVIFHLLGV